MSMDQGCSRPRAVPFQAKLGSFWALLAVPVGLKANFWPYPDYPFCQMHWQQHGVFRVAWWAPLWKKLTPPCSRPHDPSDGDNQPFSSREGGLTVCQKHLKIATVYLSNCFMVNAPCCDTQTDGSNIFCATPRNKVSITFKPSIAYSWYNKVEREQTRTKNI